MEVSKFLTSIRALGLKVTGPIYGVIRVYHWEVLGIYLLKNATEMHNLYVDEKIFDCKCCRGYRGYCLRDDKTLIDHVYIIKDHLDWENEKKLKWKEKKKTKKIL